MLRPGLLAVASLLLIVHSAALATQGTVRIPDRPCPDRSEILSYGRIRGGATSDGREGAFVVWGDDRMVSVQRFGPDGGPAPGWPALGLALGWIAEGEEGLQSFVTADSAGGALVAWIGRQGELRLQRVSPDCGVAPGWPADGVILCDLAGTGRQPAIAVTSRASAMVVWREQETSFAQSIRLARVSLAGVVVGPANGQVLAAGYDLLDRTEIVPDGGAGGIVLWRSPGEGERTTDLHLLRIQANGERATGWPAEGVVAGQRVALGETFDDEVDQPLLAADSRGGALLVWCTGRLIEAQLYETDVVAQRVTGDGRLVWAEGARTIAGDRGSQKLASIAPGPRGTLMAWFDMAASKGIRVARLDPSGTVEPWGALPAEFVERVSVESDGRGGAFVAWTTRDDVDPTPRLRHWAAAGPGREVGIAAPPDAKGWDSTRLALVTDGRGGALVAWSGWVPDGKVMRTVIRIAIERAPGR